MSQLKDVIEQPEADINDIFRKTEMFYQEKKRKSLQPMPKPLELNLAEFYVRSGADE